MRRADMYQLKITDKPVDVSLCGQIDVLSDLKDSHKVWANLDDITVRTEKKVYRPVGVKVDILTDRDTTHAIAECGDFRLNTDAHEATRNSCTELPVCRRNYGSSSRTVASIR